MPFTAGSEKPVIPVSVPVPNGAVNGSIIAESLELKPNVVELGANVTVEVTLNSTGDQQFAYPLAVKIEGSIVLAQDIVLAGGETRNLALPLPRL